jgi:hypothetical protein
MAVLWGALVLPSGCKKSEPAAETEEEVAAAGKPAVDSKIANAVKAAAQVAPPSGGAAGDLPANGVATVAQADTKMARCAASRMTMGSTGNEPRLRLGAPLKAGVPLKGVLELAVRTGPRSALPSVSLELEGASKPGPSEGQFKLELNVRKAGLANDQPGRIPEELAVGVPSLKGSSLSWVALAAGGRNPLALQLAPTVKEEFGVVLVAATELMETIALALPSEPVGMGAYWMSESRETFYQADVLAYRLIKVECIEGQKAKLSVATKRYLVGNSLSQLGLPPHEVQQFEASGEAQFVVTPGSHLPEQCQLNETMNALVSLEKNPAQQAPLQVGMRGQCAFAPGKP